MRKKKVWYRLAVVLSVILIIVAARFCTEYFAHDNVCPYSIQVDGVLYYCFMDPVEEPPEEAIAGTVQSVISITKIPDRDDQANFGQVGAAYAFVDGQLLICCDGAWYQCVLATGN